MSAVSAAATSVPGILYLVDLVGYYPGIALNTAVSQNMVQTNPITRSTDGKGLRAFLVTTTASGIGATTLQMSYTNQAGTAGKILPSTVSLTASSIVGHITHSGVAANQHGPFLPLASGDSGIRSVESVTLTTPSASGAAALCLCKVIANIPIVAASVQSERDLINQFPSLPQIDDGACLTWLYFAGAATAASTILP
jgi:hypothetical protein